MDIQATQFLQLTGQQNEMSPREIQERKEEVAESFEEIFARRLVRKMTKDTFSFDDNNGMPGNGLYRSHIVDTLARKLAEEHTFGISDLITEMWTNTARKNG